MKWDPHLWTFNLPLISSWLRGLPCTCKTERLSSLAVSLICPKSPDLELKRVSSEPLGNAAGPLSNSLSSIVMKLVSPHPKTKTYRFIEIDNGGKGYCLFARTPKMLYTMPPYPFRL